MNIVELQTRVGAKPDGIWGEKSRLALNTHFTTPKPTAAPAADIAAIAARLGCSLRQLAAVGAVESAGGGFDKGGKVKILFERHVFHRLTEGQWSPAFFSNSASGGYDQDSWIKLAFACAKDPDAAFSSASWGRFQVMGENWEDLKYPSPFDLAASLIGSETGHYELLGRFIEHNGLKDELRALSSNPDACRPFARAYNGPKYERNSYHTKLAKALG